MSTLDTLIKSGLHVKGAPLKLHLGCGMSYFQNYINIDFPQNEHLVMHCVADAEADITKDLSFPRSSVAEIRSHHVFEHFSRVIALAQLVKWHFWLKVDGVLVIETPDVMTSAKQLVDDTIEYAQKIAIIRHLTGDQTNNWGYHVDQWFADRFEITLSKFGFHIVEIENSNWAIWPYLANIKVQAIKLRDICLTEQIDTGIELLKDSMVSEREVATFNVWKEQLVEALKDVE